MAPGSKFIFGTATDVELAEYLMVEVPKVLGNPSDFEMLLDTDNEGETKKMYLYARAWTGRVNTSRTLPTQENAPKDYEGEYRHPLAKDEQNLQIRKLPSRKDTPETAYRITAEYVALDHVGPGRKVAPMEPAPAPKPSAPKK